MPEYSDYIEGLALASGRTGAEIFGVSKSGDPKGMTSDMLSNWRGDWAGTTTLPTTGGTFTGGVPGAGNEWRLTNQLVIGGNVYPAGTIIKAMANTPGQTLTNWAFISTQL